MFSKDFVYSRLVKTFAMFDELVSSLDENSLSQYLATSPSNKIGEQLWCIIGARESYLKAIQHDKWQGFNCSLKWADTANKSAVTQCLISSQQMFLDHINRLKELTPTQQNLLFDLVEHEAQHQGQLIRYMYALEISIPISWKKRFNLK